MRQYVHPHAVRRALTAILTGAFLLAPGAAGADTVYKIQPIVRLGDTVADVKVAPSGGGQLAMGTLNDSGQIAFIAANGELAGSDMLVQYVDGKFIPIVVGGRDAPGGVWDKKTGTRGASMNQRGNVAFGANATMGGNTVYGTFRWDYQAQQVTPVALTGMPPVNNNVAFAHGGRGVPVINNSDEIAFPGAVNTAAGENRSGVFFLGRDGQPQAVALPDQVLPGGGKVQDAYPTDINDAGVVAFVTAEPGQNPDGAYVWEKGTIQRVALANQVIPGVGTIALIQGASVNNQNQNVMVGLFLTGNSSNRGLYLFANGSVTPLVVPGQAMPEGGKLLHTGAVSDANDAGQRAFIGFLEDGTRSAYLLNADATISLILKTGANTDLGKITNIASPSQGIALNNKGQVALNVVFGDVTTMVVLTPTAQ